MGSHSDSRRGKRERAKKNRVRRRVIGWSIVGVVVLAVAAAAWIGVRAWLAKGELEAAIPLASSIKTEVAAGDTDKAQETADALARHAAEAARLTGDPIWRAGEVVPFVGPNLAAVRQAAAITDSIASGAVSPLVADVSAIGVAGFQPVNGAIDLAPIVAAEPTVTAASAVFSDAHTRADAIDTSGTIDQVTSAVATLQSAVADSDSLLDGVDNAMQLLPKMLGADGPRHYLLLFQNPAELRAGGGITSALAMVETDNGKVTLRQQASGSGYKRFTAPVVSIPDELRGLYSDRATTFVQNTTLVPEFPLTGQIASAMWSDSYGTAVDGVISFDPVALSYLLKATGPVTLPTGDQLTSDNAVKFLLSDVYSLYPNPAEQDAVFATAAKAVFDRVSSGNIDPKPLIDALARSANENRLKLWSSHAEDQQVLTGTALAGELPVVSADSTGIGVYFNDGTGAKMDYYLTTAVNSQAEVCRADGRPAIRVSATLTNTAPADAATALPEYVTGGGAFGVTPGNVKTLVYLYGPQSEGDMKDASIITSIDAGIAGAASRGAFDSGRPVAEISVELAPGESRTVSADFLAQPGNPLQINAQITPTINPTVYSTEINTGFSGCPIR